jgi:two-component system, chemotaxis family, protein-glutamate methylesterase/glutaminase
VSDTAPPRPDDEAPAPLLVAVGASAGGVEALTSLVREFPHDLQAAVFVVLHVSPTGTSTLAQILDRAGPLPSRAAIDGTKVAPGTIYVAPPDRHLLVDDGHLRLTVGPKENGHRPAADPTFRSLAAFGARAVGVVLSGTRDDGTAGLATIKAAGGRAFAQDPEEAAYDGMVRSATANVDIDAVLPVAELAATLTRLAKGAAMTPDDLEVPGQGEVVEDTRYTCPECGGHLSRERNGDLVRYVCEVGHAYSPESLDGEQASVVEGALWTATRLLGDRRTLLLEMASRVETSGNPRAAAEFRSRAGEAARAAEAVRSVLAEGHTALTSGTEAGADG